MCPCHDPVVFGHRCKNEPTGDYFRFQKPLDMLDVIKNAMMGAYP